jgi:hypothetical protein
MRAVIHHAGTACVEQTITCAGRRRSQEAQEGYHAGSTRKDDRKADEVLRETDTEGWCVIDER